MFIQIYIIGPIKKQNLTKDLFRSLNITTYTIFWVLNYLLLVRPLKVRRLAWLSAYDHVAKVRCSCKNCPHVSILLDNVLTSAKLENWSNDAKAIRQISRSRCLIRLLSM